MLEAKQRSDWSHTANLMALLVNINRDPKKGRVAKFEDFYPFHVDKSQQHQDLPKVNITQLRQLFGNGQFLKPR